MIGNNRRSINLECFRALEQGEFCFLFRAARDTAGRCENDLGIRGHSDWYLPCAIA